MSGPGTNASHGAGALPVDSEAGTLGLARAHRAIHLHPGYVGLVVVGGMLGALARYGLEGAIPAPGGWPLPTLLINVAGAFALGALLEGLVRRGRDAGRRRIIRLLAGTGFMGAFTTYSTLAVEATLLVDADRVAAALLYLAATLIVGALATTAGIWAGTRHFHATAARAGTTPPTAPADGGKP